jgi:hypothetical protein
MVGHVTAIAILLIIEGALDLSSPTKKTRT